MEVLTTEK